MAELSGLDQFATRVFADIQRVLVVINIKTSRCEIAQSADLLQWVPVDKQHLRFSGQRILGGNLARIIAVLFQADPPVAFSPAVVIRHPSVYRNATLDPNFFVRIGLKNQPFVDSANRFAVHTFANDNCCRIWCTAYGSTYGSQWGKGS